MQYLEKLAGAAHSALLLVACAVVVACGSAEDGAAPPPEGDAGAPSAGAATAGSNGLSGSGGAGAGSGASPGLAGESSGGSAGSAPLPDPFDLVVGGNAIDLFVDDKDEPAAVLAVNDLRADIERVSGVLPKVRRTTAGLSKRAILVGTLGKSPTIDALVATGKLDVSKVVGRWEAFAVQAVDAPVDRVERALVIAGSDRRGTAYGVYDISEAIGVSPWYWWADVAPQHRDLVTVDGTRRQQGEPSIKYRGIFINDEENFAAWSTSIEKAGAKVGPETYKKVFELLLRLKANLLWPAFKGSSDPFNKYPENSQTANDRGIVIGTSFSNIKEWTAWANSHKVDGAVPTYDYSVHQKLIYDYFDSLIAPNAKYERSYSIGMRGLNDTPMLGDKAPTFEDKVTLLGTVLADQQDILTKRTPSTLGIPLQTFMPYKEALNLYNGGVAVGDDVTALFPEDNHGFVRQNAGAAERNRAGGAGVYYHISYWGPNNQSYLWLNSTPLTLMREELQKALDTGSKQVLMLNVGDIKPAEIGIEFAMRFAYRATDFDESNVQRFVAKLAARDFSPDYADDIADIVMRYFQIVIARRPEFMTKGIYNLVSYGDEGHRRWGELSDLTKRAEAISKKLPANRVDAFYEMVLFPLRASKLTLQKYVAADSADLFAAQGRRKSVQLKRESTQAAYDAVLAEIAYYNTKTAGGKWNKIMHPFNTNQPKPGGMPDLPEVPAPGTGSALGVVVEGQTQEAAATLHFSSYTEDQRFIDVFTKTDASVAWAATPSKSWIKLSESSGTVADEMRLLVSIDWAAVPSGDSTGTITVKGSTLTKPIAIEVSKPASPSKTELQGYVEANGYVAIEAERFFTRTDRGDATWRVLTGLGRSGDSVRIFPDLSSPITSQFADKAASLDYRVYFFSTGKFPVTVFRIPTLDAVGACRFALSLDDAPPAIVSGVHTVDEAGWRKSLLEQIEKLGTTIEVTTPGYHTLHLYKVDPGIAIDRIVIDTGGLQPSYLGPPESYFN